MKPILIITVNFNDYEYFKEFNDLPNKNKVDWIYITDNNNLRSNFWNIKYLKDFPKVNQLTDNRLKTKYFKMLTHKLFPNYQYYFWMDASVNITNNNFINNLLNYIPKQLVIYRHNRAFPPSRNIIIEKDVCIKLGLVDKNKAESQINKYLKDNFPFKYKLYSCGIIFR